MKDSAEGADNDAYLRARETVRFGTITQDAADSNFPDTLVSVPYTAAGEVTEISLSGVTYSTNEKAFLNVPSKTESFTFKDGSGSKTATNENGTWSVA